MIAKDFGVTNTRDPAEVKPLSYRASVPYGKSRKAKLSKNSSVKPQRKRSVSRNSSHSRSSKASSRKSSKSKSCSQSRGSARSASSKNSKASVRRIAVLPHVSALQRRVSGPCRRVRKILSPPGSHQVDVVIRSQCSPRPRGIIARHSFKSRSERLRVDSSIRAQQHKSPERKQNTHRVRKPYWNPCNTTFGVSEFVEVFVAG